MGLRSMPPFTTYKSNVHMFLSRIWCYQFIYETIHTCTILDSNLRVIQLLLNLDRMAPALSLLMALMGMPLIVLQLCTKLDLEWNRPHEVHSNLHLKLHYYLMHLSRMNNYQFPAKTNKWIQLKFPWMNQMVLGQIQSRFIVSIDQSWCNVKYWCPLIKSFKLLTCSQIKSTSILHRLSLRSQ